MKSAMIPAAFESAWVHLVALAFAALTFAVLVAVCAWDFARATWDTLILGKTTEEQLRDYIDTD